MPLHTIRKVKFLVEKVNFDKTHIFTSFSPRIFLTIFLAKSKLSTAKKSKTTTISRVFHLEKSTIFSGKSKLNFWTKDEDFKQCVKVDIHNIHRLYDLYHHVSP